MEKKYKIEIDEDMKGARLDVVLSLALEELSRNHVQKLIESGNVLVNGQICTIKKLQLKAGDQIEIDVPEPEMVEIIAEDIPLNILYEDEDMMVVNKPKGIVVHPGAGNQAGTLVNAVMFHCGESLSSINGVVRPGIVHRIDKDTSGLLMIAKNDKAHQSLAKQLAEHTITRSYRAIVYNNFNQDEGTIERPIGRDPKNRLKQAVTECNSRRAVTHYRVLERFGDFTYIEVKLETGRTHQIRVHMAYVKHPLLGDQVYGPQKKYFGVVTQMLHAQKIGFIHPSSGEYMEFESELPEEFARVLRKLKEGK